MPLAKQVAAVAAAAHQLLPQVGLPAGAMLLPLLLLLLVHAEDWDGDVHAAEPLQQLSVQQDRNPCHGLQHPALRHCMHSVSALARCMYCRQIGVNGLATKALCGSGTSVIVMA
jgi:hypothetical protein